jgi:hypothetical protein
VSASRRTARTLAVGALSALCVLATTGCNDRRPPPAVVSASGVPGSDVGDAASAALRVADSVEAAVPDADRTRSVFAAEIAAFADSAVAHHYGDSLVADGWDVLLRRVTGDTLPQWRVRVMPTQDRDLALAVVAGFSSLRRYVQLVRDVAPLPQTRALVRRVNGGSHGERATVRWTQSADRSALLVVEDPVGPGNDPLPDGFLVASERTGTLIQRDSVWDVAPDPDWERVAFGQAFLIPASGRDSLSARGWFITMSRMNLQDVNAVQRASFLASTRRSVFGVSQPVVESLDPDPERSALLHATMAPIPMFGGWRVRWIGDGRTLAVGMAPEQGITDDAAPRRWMILDPVARLVRGELRATGTLRQLEWTEGPVIDIATRYAPAARRIAIDGGSVESRDGWIRLTSSRTGGEPVVLGPGTLLAATRGGDFVAALAPALQARPEDPRVQAVVYRLVP